MEWQPDEIVSDIGMPEEDGYAPLPKVRELPPERGGRIPAAALTAYANIDGRTQLLLPGFEIQVPKPMHPTELAAAIAKIAGRTGCS